MLRMHVLRAESPKRLASKEGPCCRYSIGFPRKMWSSNSRGGVATKTEETGKVFPVSDRAIDVRDALVKRLKESGAELRTGARSSMFRKMPSRIGLKFELAANGCRPTCFDHHGRTQLQWLRNDWRWLSVGAEFRAHSHSTSSRFDPLISRPIGCIR